MYVKVWILVLIFLCRSSPSTPEDLLLNATVRVYNPASERVGGGVVIGKDIIVTAEHVASSSEVMMVRVYGHNDIFTGKVVLRDFANDLVLVQVDIPKSAAFVEIGTNVALDSEVYLVHHPADIFWAFSRGRVIAVGRTATMQGVSYVYRVFVLEAQVLPGSSGGGVFQDGKIVGILVGMASVSSFSYAIEAEHISKALETWRRNNK